MQRKVGGCYARVGRMELKRFRYFIAVAEEKHFGRAAERLGIAQPGLSQQIKALERSLDTQLLTRHSRGADLTEAGAAFLVQARLAVEFAERAVASARLPERGKSAVLKVGTRAAGIPPVAQRLLENFITTHPEAEVEVHPGFVPQLIEGLSRRSIDVATLLRPFVAEPPLNFMRLGSLNLKVALPEDHRLATLERVPPAELLNEPFLDWPRSGNPPLYDHAHRMLFGSEKHPRLVEAAEFVDSRRLPHVAAGEAISVVVLEPPPFPGVVIRPFEDPAPAFEYGLGWYEPHLSPLVPAFVELAAKLAEPPSKQGKEASLLG